MPQNAYKILKKTENILWKTNGQKSANTTYTIPIVISAPKNKEASNQYYHPEDSQDIYLRFGYKSYLNGEFQKSLKYFEDFFSVNQNYVPAYLYASYSAEALYNQKKNDKYLELAKEYIKKAKQLEPENKYILEQEQILK